jgi:predicted permease
VVSEISLALLLLVGAAMLIRTLAALRSVNPGFDARNTLTTKTTLDSRLAKTTGVEPIVRRTLTRLRSTPGVESAAHTRLVPLDGGFNLLPVIVSGRPLSAPAHGYARRMLVSEGYFETLRIPLVRGRLFAEADGSGAANVAIINRAMAQRLWRDSDPLNHQVLIGSGLANLEDAPRRIVGVVGDVKENELGSTPPPAIFIPAAQLPNARREGRPVSWLIRTRGPSQALHATIEDVLRQATGAPVPPLSTMDEVIVRSTSRQNFNMVLMTTFGVSALVLAAIGIYALMSYSVQQRGQEIGIRLALGAESRDVRNMIVRQGMQLTVIGIVLGLAAAAGLTRYVASNLYGVRAYDPLIFGGAPLPLALVALIAVWLPAERASRVDPLRALRSE